MASPRKLSIPTRILSDCRFAAWPNYPGTTPRPSGAGLTGADIALWWIVLDRASDADENGVVFVPQLDFTRMAGKVDPVRIAAALIRLEGTDMMHGPSVYPTVRSHGQHGKGTKRSRWAIELSPKVIALMKEEKAAGWMTTIDTDDMRPLSSRLSMVLWCRWLSILDGVYPLSRDILIGKDDYTAAMELTVPIEHIAPFFGRYDPLARSEVNRLLLTDSDRCPIKKEMMAAGVACDITRVTRAGFKDDFAIEIQMTTLFTDTGSLRYLSARQRHQDLKRAAIMARLGPRRPPVANPSA